MKAFRIINKNGTDSSFEEGSILEGEQIAADYFVVRQKFEPYQLSKHPAPRYQFVITLKGKLKFTVTNGDSFIIEPGIVLIAEDVHGDGHSWEILDGTEWHRIYIVPKPGTPDFFVPLKKYMEGKENKKSPKQFALGFFY